MEISSAGSSIWGLIVLIIASGFTLAGLLTSIHASFANSGPDFRLSFESPIATLWTLVLCMFAGPFIIVQNTSKYWRKGFLSNSILIFGMTLSMMWSFCSGVFIVQLAAYAGLITV